MRYFYYRIYKQLTKIKTNDTPYLNAMLLIVMLQGLNIYTIFTVLSFYFNYEIDKNLSSWSLFSIVLILNYFYLFRQREKIINRYQNETKEDQTWGAILLIFYIVFSVTVFFVAVETLKISQ